MPAVARRDYLKVQLSHPDSELLARWDVWLENLILNQTGKKKCLPVLYFRHLVKLRKKCTRARTHTHRILTLYVSITLSTLSMKALQALLREGVHSTVHFKTHLHLPPYGTTMLIQSLLNTCDGCQHSL